MGVGVWQELTYGCWCVARAYLWVLVCGKSLLMGVGVWQELTYGCWCVARAYLWVLVCGKSLLMGIGMNVDDSTILNLVTTLVFFYFSNITILSVCKKKMNVVIYGP